MKFKLLQMLVPATAVAFLVAGCAKEQETEADDMALQETAEIFTPPVAAQPAPQPAQQPARQPAAVRSPDTVLAIVGGKEFTQGDVNSEITKMFPDAANVPPEQLAQVQAQMNQQILSSMIIREILNQEADARNIEVSDQQLEEQIEEMKASLPPGVTLEQQLQNIGIDHGEFRDLLKGELRINNLFEQELDLKDGPAEEVVRAYYDDNPELFQRGDTVRASHILVRFESPEEEMAARAKIEGIHARLQENPDVFAELAAQHSDCPSGQQGGDLGAFERGQMVPPFENAAFSQEIDVIGPVITTDFGFHIVKTTERLPAGQAGYEEVAEAIAQRIRQQAVSQYVEELKNKADVSFPGL